VKGDFESESKEEIEREIKSELLRYLRMEMRFVAVQQIREMRNAGEI